MLILSPSRLKKGCSSTRTVIYKSPAAPPATPAFPFPATRSRDPDATPCGILTSTASERLKRPSPRQVGHAFFNRPVPPQRLHVRLNFIAPAICVTVPLPSHSGQTATPLPELPVPWHVSHVSCREIFSFTCVPRMDCQKSTFKPYSKSAPRSGCTAWRAFPPPKNWPKMSRKLPPPRSASSNPAPPAALVPPYCCCCRRNSAKSNPSK